MAGLCGWFGAPREATGDILGLQEAGLPSVPGESSARCDGPRGGCLVQGGWVAQAPDGLIAGITGHPRWREQGLQRLALEQSPAHALLDAYRRFGEALFSQLAGDFVVAILDPERPRLLAGVDRMGQASLHWAAVPGGVVFGTTAGSVVRYPGLSREPTPSGLYHYLFFHMLPAPVSVFAGVEKLRAAHYLERQADTIRVKPYWLPHFREARMGNAAEMGTALRDQLRNAVKQQRETPKPGAFLSGGLDSSTVAGLLAETTPEPPPTFSIGFDAPGYDEMEYARIAARHFATQANEYYVTPDDVVAAVPLIAGSYDEPFGNSSALPAYFCARMAAQAGVTRMLAGDGGDELFAGNARYAKQGLFEHWQRLPRPLRQGMLEPLMTRIPQQAGWLGKARRYVEQARIPLPDRLQTYNYLYHLSPTSMFEPEFLAAVDTRAPWDLMREIHDQPAHASPLNRMMYLDWQQTLADNDLRKVTRMCELAGVDVVFPMLDDDVVEFSLGIPSDQKLRGQRLRHFYKEAMQGFLPDAIIDKKKHGFGLPFGVWMHDHAPLRELAYDSLLRLKGQGFLRPQFIDELISLHRDGHAAYYGDMVWVLMMLDLWLHAPSSEMPAEARAQAGGY